MAAMDWHLARTVRTAGQDIGSGILRKKCTGKASD